MPNPSDLGDEEAPALQPASSESESGKCRQIKGQLTAILGSNLCHQTLPCQHFFGLCPVSRSGKPICAFLSCHSSGEMFSCLGIDETCAADATVLTQLRDSRLGSALRPTKDLWERMLVDVFRSPLDVFCIGSPPTPRYAPKKHRAPRLRGLRLRRKDARDRTPDFKAATCFFWPMWSLMVSELFLEYRIPR